MDLKIEPKTKMASFKEGMIYEAKEQWVCSVRDHKEFHYVVKDILGNEHRLSRKFMEEHFTILDLGYGFINLPFEEAANKIKEAWRSDTQLFMNAGINYNPGSYFKNQHEQPITFGFADEGMNYGTVSMYETIDENSNNIDAFNKAISILEKNKINQQEIETKLSAIGRLAIEFAHHRNITIEESMRELTNISQGIFEKQIIYGDGLDGVPSGLLESSKIEDEKRFEDIMKKDMTKPKKEDISALDKYNPKNENRAARRKREKAERRNKNE